jgi:hypothetical protein
MNSLKAIYHTSLVFLAVTGDLAFSQSPDVDEPFMAEIPNACGYLTEDLATSVLRAPVKQGYAKDHIPNFWSQCHYTGKGVVGRKISFVFKFMLFDLTDVKKLEPMQLNFNASFATGGIPPTETLKDLGKISFVFKDRDLTTIMMVTGIQGPLDGAKRPSELIATYQFSDPDTPHEQRRDELLVHARKQLEEWLGMAQ